MNGEGVVKILMVDQEQAAKLFRTRRKALGFETQASFANTIGVSEETVKKWENGTRRIPKHALKHLERIEVEALRSRRK